MNEFVCYRENGKLEVADAGQYASIREWSELCQDAGAELVGIGLFDCAISAELYFRDVANAS